MEVWNKLFEADPNTTSTLIAMTVVGSLLLIFYLAYLYFKKF